MHCGQHWCNFVHSDAVRRTTATTYASLSLMRTATTFGDHCWSASCLLFVLGGNGNNMRWFWSLQHDASSHWWQRQQHRVNCCPHALFCPCWQWQQHPVIMFGRHCAVFVLDGNGKFIRWLLLVRDKPKPVIMRSSLSLVATATLSGDCCSPRNITRFVCPWWQRQQQPVTLLVD